MSGINETDRFLEWERSLTKVISETDHAVSLIEKLAATVNSMMSENIRFHNRVLQLSAAQEATTDDIDKLIESSKFLASAVEKTNETMNSTNTVVAVANSEAASFRKIAVAFAGFIGAAGAGLLGYIVYMHDVIFKLANAYGFFG